MTFVRKRTVPSTPASLVNLARAAAGSSWGASRSTPTSDQVPGRDERPARFERRAGDGARGIVGRGRDHGRVAVWRRWRSAQLRAGVDEIGHQRTNRAEPEPIEEFVVPRARAHVEQLRGGRVGPLAEPRAAQEVMAEIGDQQQPPRLGREAVALMRGELIDRVQRQKLDARAREHLLPRHAREHVLHHSGGAFVAIADRLLIRRSLASSRP